MTSHNSHIDAVENLRDIMKVIRWMDKYRWNEHEQVSYLAAIEPYMNLNHDQKILAHWLCYITDRVRSVDQVWSFGGTIFSELVSDYCSKKLNDTEGLIAMLRDENYLQESKSGKISTFVSKNKYPDGDKCDHYYYAPRFGSDLLSILRSLSILTKYKESLTEYIISMKSFWHNSDDELGRVAFILYILSYGNTWNAGKNVKKLDKKGIQNLVANVEEQLDVINSIYASKATVEQKYNEWNKSNRYHKRLWAALRDYLKNELFKDYFSSKIGFSTERDKLLEQLELPGDVWNDRFSENFLKPQLSNQQHNKLSVYIKNSAKTVRRMYEWLRDEGEELDGYYPEQFDVSYNFASRMCENQLEMVCPFGKNGSHKICLGDYAEESKYCPVILVTCGYIGPCKDEECPIISGIGKGTCSGCQQ